VDLSEVQKRYTDASARVSDLIRQLGFAGIATIWLFSGGTIGKGGTIAIAHGLRWSLLLMVVSLLMDLIHTAYRAGLWGLVGWKRERANQTTDITVPRPALWLSLWLFWGKLGVLVLAYVLLAIYFFGKIT
jgi:hypothetical protein